MIYVPGAHDTLGTHWVLSTKNRLTKGPQSDKMINEFAGQAVCRQKSPGLTLHHAWSRPDWHPKIMKLQVKWWVTSRCTGIPSRPRQRWSEQRQVSRHPAVGCSIWTPAPVRFETSSPTRWDTRRRPAAGQHPARATNHGQQRAPGPGLTTDRDP